MQCRQVQPYNDYAGQLIQNYMTNTMVRASSVVHMLFCGADGLNRNDYFKGLPLSFFLFKAIHFYLSSSRK